MRADAIAVFLLAASVYAADTSHVEDLRVRCGHCHGGPEDVGEDVDLASLTPESLAGDAELQRRLLRVLDLREMPPEDEPPWPDDAREAAVGELRRLLSAVPAEAARTPVRRMTRLQYNNAVVDLFGLRRDVFALPERMIRAYARNGRPYFDPAAGRMPDAVTVGCYPLGKSQMIEPHLAGATPFPQDRRAEHGFDNRADHLSMSPLLMGQFLDLGRAVVRSKDFTPKTVGRWGEWFAEDGPPVRGRVASLLRRAFREQPDAATVERYADFAAARVDAGATVTDALKDVAAAVLASPRFLYLRDESVASRLAAFLWNGMPDDRLRKLEASGELADGAVLRAEINRLMADRRSKRFVDSFAAQWLQLERIVSSEPDPETFPAFYYSKYRDSMHMALEPLLLFEAVYVEDRPLTDLIDPDFSYRSGHLTEAYGDLAAEANALPGPEFKKHFGPKGQVTQLTFRRVPLPDRRTGGVVTNAAVMTMTSGPHRTQPITRGAWVAAVVFNNPPDPPPADVPPLAEKPPAGEENLTLRERLAAHRERADYRGCHEQIDPLGFALENFDPVGRWRDAYENGRAVDAAGTLFRTHAFGGPVTFKDAVLAERRRFERALAGHLLSYALARELAPSDEAALDAIVDSAGGTLRGLIREVAMSRPFRGKAVTGRTIVHAE